MGHIMTAHRYYESDENEREGEKAKGSKTYRHNNSPLPYLKAQLKAGWRVCFSLTDLSDMDKGQALTTTLLNSQQSYKPIVKGTSHKHCTLLHIMSNLLP